MRESCVSGACTIRDNSQKYIQILSPIHNTKILHIDVVVEIDRVDSVILLPRLTRNQLSIFNKNYSSGDREKRYFFYYASIRSLSLYAPFRYVFSISEALSQLPTYAPSFSLFGGIWGSAVPGFATFPIQTSREW